MENETEYDLQNLNLNKNDLKYIFKELIEDTRNSTEKQSQEILNLLNSIKEETEKKISKSKILFLLITKFFIFLVISFCDKINMNLDLSPNSSSSNFSLKTNKDVQNNPINAKDDSIRKSITFSLKKLSSNNLNNKNNNMHKSDSINEIEESETKESNKTNNFLKPKNVVRDSNSVNKNRYGYEKMKKKMNYSDRKSVV